MNNTPRSADPLQAYLRTLPEPLPPAALWPQVERSRRRRRWRRLGLRALAATLALGLLFGLRPQPRAPVDAGLAATPVAPAGLRALDRRLQAAYERGDADESIAPLWRDRDLLLLEPDNQDPNHERILRL